MPTTGVPKGWPDDVVYLSRCSADPTLSKPQAHLLTRLLQQASRAVQRPQNKLAAELSAGSRSPPVKISKIEDRNHPAHGQRGLFAAKKLSPGQFVLEYIGYMVMEPYCSQTSDYILRLLGDIAVDAERGGNEARFINDYRGIGKRCNVLFENFISPTGQLAIGIFVGNKPIAKGEELLLSYGKGFWSARANHQELPDFEL